MKRFYTWLLVPLSLALAGVLLSCSSNNNNGGGNAKVAGGGTPTADQICAVGSGTSGNNASLKIGSKAFAEEQLLATMTKLVLERNGFKVDFSTQAADPAIDNALRSGTIDMLWQYTGTELQNFLNVDSPPTDLTQAFQQSRQLDAIRNNLCWVAPAPLDDTNGIAIRASDQSKYGTTLSQFATYLQNNPNTTVCIMSEFRTRPDGLPGLAKTYGGGFQSATNAFKDIGSTAESAIASGQCAAGEVFTTDSAIAANNLAVLQDDKKLFPPDNVGLIVRASVLKQYPAISNLMAPVAAKLTTDEMTKLNKSVEVDKMNVNDVALAWLRQNGILK